MAQVIETAIGLEKESILFYLGLKDIVPPKLGRVKIDEIIEEEKRHGVRRYMDEYILVLVRLVRVSDSYVELSIHIFKIYL